MIALLRVVAIVAAVALWPLAGVAHHSMAEWDTSIVEEMEGEVVSVVWRNPHIRWTMRIRNDEGEDELWTMAGTSPNHLTRRGVTAETLSVGEVIRVVGSPSTRRPLNFIVNSALLPDQTEVLLRGLGPAVDPHWPNARAVIGTGEWGAAEAAAAEPRGLFTVWRSVRGVGGREPLSLTPEAEAVLATWNVADNWVVRCERRGMPSTMGNPYPREFVDQGDTIVLRIEEHDNVRVIHMTGAVDPATQPASRLGYSVGRWEDERTLVVETTRINFPWYNTSGVPQSEDVKVFERFTLSEDELRLGYEQIVTDPATFTAPARLTGEWAAIPGIEIQRFDMDCSDDAYL
ncbi:MAG TPA: DUF6152 family protein [Gammaproteobacteria bacterium]